MFEEERDFPEFVVGEIRSERRHCREADAVLEFPKRHAVGIVFYALFREHRRFDVKAFCERRRFCIGSAVANGAVGAVGFDARDEILVGVRDGIRHAVARARDRHMQRLIRRSLFDCGRFVIGTRR